MSGDAISIVEAAYDLASDTNSWLTRLLDAVAPRLDRGFGVAWSSFDMRPGRGEPAILVSRGMDERMTNLAIELARADPGLLPRAHTFPAPAATLSQTLGLTESEAAETRLFKEGLYPFGARDALGVVVPDPEGPILVVSGAMPDTRRPTKHEVAMWGRIAAHVAAGARLRRSLSGTAPSAPGDGAEAILSPSGAVQHAEAGAQGSTARESLHAAAKAIDRARSKARRNDDEALELWRGLVAGRWSLVEQFDSDGRRLLVAHRNDPQVSDPRALTLRERQVLAYTALGHPLKLISYTLGLSLGTVSMQRARGMRKLGLRTQADLVQLFTAVSERPPAGRRGDEGGP